MRRALLLLFALSLLVGCRSKVMFAAPPPKLLAADVEVAVQRVIAKGRSVHVIAMVTNRSHHHVLFTDLNAWLIRLPSGDVVQRAGGDAAVVELPYGQPQRVKIKFHKRQFKADTVGQMKLVVGTVADRPHQAGPPIGSILLSRNFAP